MHNNKYDYLWILSSMHKSMKLWIQLQANKNTEKRIPIFLYKGIANNIEENGVLNNVNWEDNVTNYNDLL